MREPAIVPERTQVTVAEARDTILGSVHPLGAETVSLRAAQGRVLAEEVRAQRHIPPLDNSAMDGYALRAADVRRVPAELRVVEELPAGKRSEVKLGPGEAARILTGAAVPDGADAVVMQEYAQAHGARVVVLRSVQPGENIRRAGADVKPGTPVAGPGTLLRPTHVGMLAAIGRTTVSVVARPRVAILATGDELVEPDRLGDDGRIVTSNSYSLQAALQVIGAEPVYLGITPDRPAAIEAAFRRALACDVVISTGGVSVGDRDWIKSVLAAMGGTLRLWRVRMKPGAPLAFALLEGRMVFALPGNPVSTLVAFEQFVRPALLRMMRHEKLFRPVVPARLAESYEKRPGRVHFLRVVLQDRDGECHAVPTGDQSSGVLLSMVRADGLAIVPEEATRIEAGAWLPVLLRHSEDLRADPGF